MRSITPTHAIWRLAGVLLVAALLLAPARAADDTGLKVDSLVLQDKPVQAVPDVLLRTPGQQTAQRQALSAGQALPPGTELTLPRGATAVLLSRNDNRITLFPGTVFIVGTVTDPGESHQPVAGKAEFDVRRALDFFNVSYARFTAAVKGTVWSVDISPASQTIAFDVREGWVEVEQRVPVRLRGGSGTDDNDDDTQAPQGAEVQLVDDLAAGQQRRYDLGVERYLQEFGNFGEAEASYRQALADAEAGGSPQRLHRALANLMAIAYTLGRPQIAIDLGPRCEDAARATRLPQAMQACDNAVGNALGKLGRHREALAYHQRVLDAERARPSGRDGTWTAAALNNLAIGDRGLGQIGRAVQLQQESVQMRQRLDGGRDSIELARVTGNLAGMQRLVGALPQSVTLYGQAIEMVQRLQNGAPHPLLANLLADLGMAQLEQGDLVAAMARLQDALRMNEQLFPGREHLSKAQCIAQIGDVLLREGQLPLAQARLEESLAMRRRLLGTIDHPAIATNLGNLGAVLRAMKRPADALPLQEQALAMRRRLADNRDHQAVATSMANLALARADAGQLPEAVALLQQSIAMFQAVYGAVDHPDIAHQLHNLGSLQMRQRRPADAAASYDMSAAMLGRLAGDRPGAARAAALAGQSRAELEAGHADRARALQSEALRLRKALQGGQPRTVLLDIWISSTPEGVDTLATAVAALQQRGTRVLAAVEPKDRQGLLRGDFMHQHNARFYSQVVDGDGHTQLDAAGGLLYFRCRLALPSAQGQTLLTALPAVAVPGEDCREQTVVIALGDDAAFAPLTHRPAADGAGFEPPFTRTAMPELVIVGSLAADSDNHLARPGPVLLAWAMSDLLRSGQRVARRPLNHPAAAIGLAVAAALATLLVYRLAFRSLRVRIAPTRWLHLATVLVPLALAGATGLLLAGAGLVALDGGPVVPLAMPLAMAAVAAGWAWTRARDWVREERLHADLAAPGEERAIAYDVFVSDAHDPPEHQAWVQAQVVAPLAALRRPDGQPLRIFFDTTSIKVGRRWKAEIELALLGTRCVVPVCSARYFERPYCREEIELADQLRIEGRLQMLPVARTVDAIPERWLRKLQYIDARSDTVFAPALCAQVAAALGDSGTAVAVQSTVTRPCD